MTEENKLSDLQKAFIDEKNKEIEFVKNVADVKRIKNDYELSGLEADKRKFFLNGKNLENDIQFNEYANHEFSCYKHKDGTDVFIQSVCGYYGSDETTLLVKGHDYLCFRTSFSEDEEKQTHISIGKLDREKPDVRLNIDGEIDEIKLHNPDLYDLYNKYVPQDINTGKIISKLTGMKEHREYLQRRKNETNNKTSEATAIKEALNKWNSGR